MSPSNKGKGSGGFDPAPARLTPEEFQSLGLFFKGLLNENPLIKASIIAAGVAGVLESLHIAWLAARYIWKF